MFTFVFVRVSNFISLPRQNHIEYSFGNLNVCNLERVWIRFREKTDLETEQETELNFYNNNNLSIR